MWSFYKPPQQTSIVFQRIFLLRSFFCLFVSFSLCVCMWCESFSSPLLRSVWVWCAKKLIYYQTLKWLWEVKATKAKKFEQEENILKENVHCFINYEAPVHISWFSLTEVSQASWCYSVEMGEQNRDVEKKSLRVVCVCTLCIVYTNLYTRLGTDASQKI